MEQNHVFEADGALQNDNAGSSKHASGFEATAQAAGDMSFRPVEEEAEEGEEDTLLLGRRDSVEGSEDGRGDDERQPLTGGEPTWSHFMDRPWWRRPSVCPPATLRRRLATV